MKPGRFKPRSSGIARPKRIRSSNPKRKAANFKRAYHSVERVEFVASLPCFGCGVVGSGVWVEDDYQTIANAHTKNGGTSKKGPYTTIIPLCETIGGAGCHDKQHQHGWSALGPLLDTPDKRQAAAEATERAWLLYSRTPE